MEFFEISGELYLAVTNKFQREWDIATPSVIYKLSGCTPSLAPARCRLSATCTAAAAVGEVGAVVASSADLFLKRGTARLPPASTWAVSAPCGLLDCTYP